jgi:hypothetical protein
MAGRLGLSGLTKKAFKAKHASALLESMVIDGMGKKAIAAAVGDEPHRIVEMVRYRLSVEMQIKLKQSSELESSFSDGGPWFEQYRGLLNEKQI